MKSVMAMGVVGAVVVGAVLCAMCWTAGAPEKAAKPALPIIPGAAEVESGKTAHHSTDFGWAANQDITEQFAKLLQSGKLKAGEELVLDHTYRISIGGSHRLPARFTLSAVKGAGLDVTGPAGKNVSTPLLELDDGSAVRNLTITYLDTPPLGRTGIRHGVNFFDWIGIQGYGKKDLLIENCRMTGSIAHHIKLVNCSRPKVIGCHISGGFWTIALGGVTDAAFQRCLIEKCQGDGMKVGVRGVLVEDCVFQDNGRDGIDSTGGFNDAIVRNTIFRRLGVCGMDLKSFYGTKADLTPKNVNILVENCQFYDLPNAIVFTTEDYGLARGGPGKELLNAANIKIYAPHDVDVNDCLIGHSETPLRPTGKGGYGVDYPKEGEYMRMFLLKDAYAIRYRNVRFSGERIMPVYVRSNGGSTHLSKEAAQALDHSVTGNVLAEPGPPIKPGVTEVPFACGP